jgi:hypothetical protein
MEPQRIAYADCQEADDVLTLVLAEHTDGAGPTIRFQYWRDLDIPEVITGDGRSARHAVNAWKPPPMPFAGDQIRFTTWPARVTSSSFAERMV